jgi:hypothetical protein
MVGWPVNTIPCSSPAVEWKTLVTWVPSPGQRVDAEASQQVGYSHKHTAQPSAHDESYLPITLQSKHQTGSLSRKGKHSWWTSPRCKEQGLGFKSGQSTPWSLHPSPATTSNAWNHPHPHQNPSRAAQPLEIAATPQSSCCLWSRALTHQRISQPGCTLRGILGIPGICE